LIAPHFSLAGRLQPFFESSLSIVPSPLQTVRLVSELGSVGSFFLRLHPARFHGEGLSFLFFFSLHSASVLRCFFFCPFFPFPLAALRTTPRFFRPFSRYPGKKDSFDTLFLYGDQRLFSPPLAFTGNGSVAVASCPPLFNFSRLTTWPPPFLILLFACSDCLFFF